MRAVSDSPSHQTRLASETGSIMRGIRCELLLTFVSLLNSPSKVPITKIANSTLVITPLGKAVLPMNWTLLFTCLLIATARVADVTLDTLRTAAVVQGRRFIAAGLGFIGSMIYILAISKVLQHLDHWAYAVAYGAGFAAGNFLGITIERRIALGEQIVSIFTREGDRLAESLRLLGHRVTQFEGRGRDGAVAALYIEVPRRQAKKVLEDARRIDASCFYMIHDVRVARAATCSEPMRMRIAA